MPSAHEIFTDPLVLQVCATATRGDLAELRALTSTGVSLSARGLHGMTPLHWSIVDGDMTATTTLLEAGAPSDAMDDDGHTAMEWGARLEDPRLLVLLLQHGGDPNATTHRGEPLLLATAAALNLPHLALLIDNGAEIDSTGLLGQTAVMRLAIMNQFEAVEDLLLRGADHTIIDASGGSLALYTQESRVSTASPQFDARRRVQALLKARGIAFPVPRP